MSVFPDKRKQGHTLNREGLRFAPISTIFQYLYPESINIQP